MRSGRRFVSLTLAVASLYSTASLRAQEGTGTANGRPITPASYDEWRAIQGATLTNDGAWAVYTLSHFIGEGELVARSTRNTTEYRVPRGYVARPNLAAGSFGGFRAPAPAITADSRWVVFSIEPPPSAVEQARRAKKRPADQPKSTLAIMDLRSGNVTRIDRVRSYRIAPKGASVVAYIKEPDSAAAAARPPADTANKDRKDEGSLLVVRDLTTGTEVQVPDVASHVLSEDGLNVAYVVSTKDGAGDGAFVRALPQVPAGGFASGAVTTLATGAGRYRALAFDKAGKQVAFTTDKDEWATAKSRARYALYHARLGANATAALLVPSSQVGGNQRIAANGTIDFTRDGNGLLFGVGPEPVELLPADSLVERAVFDLWHYQDDFLQPTQKQNAEQMRQPWYEAVYWLDEKRWNRVGNDSVPDIQFSFDGKVGMAASTFPYRIRGMWGDMRSDLFVVDARTGKWTLVKRAMEPSGGPVPTPIRGSQADASLSPGGKYVLFWERKNWHSYNVATGKTVNLTENIPVAFWNELDDHPALPGSYGQGGWTTDDSRVLLNDRFDIWEVDPSGTVPPKNLTDGVGRQTKTIFRVTDIDRANREEPWLDPSKPLYLSATDWETKATGIYREQLTSVAATAGGRRAARPADGPPVRLVHGDRQYRVLGKAKDAEQFLVTQETFREFPDLWTGSAMASLSKISNANPQQAQYRWGTAQLVTYTSTRGVPLKAILYKPDGFDPARKYPMMVHTYERVTQQLHGYVMPRPSGASVNVARFVSNGYVVLMPDIVYEDGHPGQSFVSAVVPATQALIDSGFVDPKRIGFEGFSWGGYQGAYLATQSDMFAAIAPGAPVANMSSAYGGIRWSGGVNRSMQYERTQSRIGATPWEKPELYIENSALFHIDKVRTPLLFMHNDADGAVPWYQGIELYIALRRLQREAYLFNYNDDGHGVSKTANQLDWDMRLWDFFDHHLRGAPKPDWMVKGIPYIQKGRDQAPAVKAVIQP